MVKKTPTPAKTKKTAAKSTKNKMVFKMTDKAVTHLKRLAKEMEKENFGLKIEVIPGGCSGYKYFMDFEEKPEPKDQIHEIDGVKIFIDEESVGMIEGATLDYIDSLQGAGFNFDNPNVKKSCHCGKSFC